MEKYDVIIIGAGIGGLVCGCYLAKAGLKVLIVEQHNKPGGYCTSFERRGYKFDVGVHYLGSCREGGILNRIFNELSLLQEINFLTNDPCDRIITKDKTIFIRKKQEDTKQELINNFPKEKNNIENFFRFLTAEDFLSILSKTKNYTFEEALNGFFYDYKLKQILAIPIVGNLGLPPHKASALLSIILYKEFILDGGYYPKGGIQIIPDSLANKFISYGGEIIFSRKVNKIITKYKKVCGVKLNNDAIIFGKYIVSNADATLTFKKLLDCDSKERKLVNKLEISPSACIVYLGINKDIKDIVPKHYLTWYFSSYDLKNCYAEQEKRLFPSKLNNFLCCFPSLIDPSLAPENKSILRIFLGAKYAEEKTWTQNKTILYDKLILKLNTIISDFSNSMIDVFEIATPYTLNRFTSNRNGALFGWASTKNQVDRNIFPSETSIENLYLSSHWVTNGLGQSGIAITALCGRNTANLIIKRKK